MSYWHWFAVAISGSMAALCLFATIGAIIDLPELVFEYRWHALANLALPAGFVVFLAWFLYLIQ